jgi:hypothetical protein
MTEKLRRKDLTIVLDTNVMLDLYSCHDYEEAMEKLGGELVAPINDPRLVYRRQRARDALLLGIWMHHTRQASNTLNEAIVQLKINVKTEKDVDLNKETPEERIRRIYLFNFTSIFMSFVTKAVLGEWGNGRSYEGRNADLVKDVADDKYVDVARTMKLPLMTNEGFGHNGLTTPKQNKPNIVTKAAAVGVKTYTPGQYYALSGRNEAKDIAWFLEQFEAEAPNYIRRNEENAEAIMNAVARSFDYYHHVLLGSSGRQVDPVKVKTLDWSTTPPTTV